MSQKDVYRFLEKRTNELFTSDEIAVEIMTDRGRVVSALKKLRRLFPICQLTRGHQKTPYYSYCKNLEHHMKLRKQAQNKTNGTTMVRCY